MAASKPDNPKPSDADSSDPLRLDIGPVVRRADEICETVQSRLTSHRGLTRASHGVAAAAREAEQVARRLKRPLGLHRMPALFLFASLGLFGLWVWYQFFHVSELTIALSARDAVALKRNVETRVRFVPLETIGSRLSVKAVVHGEADLAFVQGGIDFPDNLLHTELESSELVLFYLRDGIPGPAAVRKVLTSSEGQGSHTLAQKFFRIWDIDQQVSFTHDWRDLTDSPDAPIDENIDAVFVVKDPMSEKITRMAARLQAAGFHAASPDIGASVLRLPYLHETEIRPGYFDPLAMIPPESVKSYRVSTYLIGRPDLTPRQIAAASELLKEQDHFQTDGFTPDVGSASEVVQGFEAALGVIVYIGLASLALLGLDLFAYRRRFNELNSLVSLISMHQGEKDVVLGTPSERSHNVEYLGVCSDLLGLISVITGYYAQENSSLMYHRLFEVIHERCSGLKLNIQLKILHAMIDLPEGPSDSNDQKDSTVSGGSSIQPDRVSPS